MHALTRHALGAVAAISFAAGAAAAADLKLGLSVSLSGSNSSIGVPYAKSMQAALPTSRKSMAARCD